MRILVTGSSGWLGRFLVPRLRQAGHHLLGLDSRPGPTTTLFASITDHGLTHLLASEEIEAAVAAGVGRFVFTSTTSLMIGGALHAARDSGAECAAWIDEDLAPLEPRNIYGVTKLAAEHLCRIMFQERGLPAVVLRTGRFFPEAD